MSLPYSNALPYSSDNLSKLPNYRFMNSIERQKMVESWRLFEEIFAKNLDVYNQRQTGKQVGYYVFTSNAYRISYKLGEQLHTTIFPEYNWRINY
jgi:hypothetical protein